MGWVETYRGRVDARDLGLTLIHEHVFVRNPELERNLHDEGWDEDRFVDEAVATLDRLHDLGVRTVVDLTVPGLGRDAAVVARVAERTRVNLVASTGWYTPASLPLFFALNGPGRVVEGTDALTTMFVRDITEGIAGTGVRAGMIKIATDAAGFTGDVVRVMEAAAVAHLETGVAITTHSVPSTRNGLEQQEFFVERGVAPDRLVIGHSCDTDDLAYLRTLMDNGSTLGMDRFGMTHVFPDDLRLETVIALAEEGYADRMVLSHDAAVYSHVTPPAWRAAHTPDWRMDALFTTFIPRLIEGGVSQSAIDRMLIDNPRRLLEVEG